MLRRHAKVVTSNEHNHKMSPQSEELRHRIVVAQVYGIRDTLKAF